MKKIIVLILIATLFFVFNVTSSSYATTTPVYDETYNNNQGAFYANGTPIVISESEGNTVITWKNGNIVVPNSVSIFGGGVGENYTSSQITMNGGIVQNITGGGIGYTADTSSEVTTTNIVINNGTVTNSVVGGGYFYSKTTTSNVELNGGTVLSLQGGALATGKISGVKYSVGSKDDSINSPCRVDNANVVINGGTITSLLFAGGQGYSYTGIANLIINDGNMSNAYVTAAGSNGYTEAGNVKIAGGTIGVYQSVNRGTVNSVSVKQIGGKIDKFYVGGETEDSTVTGILEKVEVNLVGGNITMLAPGTSNGNEISIDNETYKVAATEDVKVINDNIPSSKIKIEYDFDVSHNSLKLSKNDTQKLDVIVKTNPTGYENVFEDTISFISKNPEIAVVSNDGTVTGIDKGSTSIEINVGEKLKTIDVTVEDSNLYIPVGIVIVVLILVLLLVLFLV